MTLSVRSFAAAIVFASLLPLAGCGRATTQEDATAESAEAAPGAPGTPAHDPDDVPITEEDVDMPGSYSDAIPRIESYRDQIRDAVAAGTPAKAHRPLDELDIVLKKLPAIAKESGISIEQWETINTSARDLRDSFNQVHAAIDENRQPDFEAIAVPVEQAIDKLKQVTP